MLSIIYIKIITRTPSSLRNLRAVALLLPHSSVSGADVLDGTPAREKFAGGAAPEKHHVYAFHLVVLLYIVYYVGWGRASWYPEIGREKIKRVVANWGGTQNSEQLYLFLLYYIHHSK